MSINTKHQAMSPQPKQEFRRESSLALKIAHELFPLLSLNSFRSHDPILFSGGGFFFAVSRHHGRHQKPTQRRETEREKDEWEKRRGRRENPPEEGPRIASPPSISWETGERARGECDHQSFRRFLL